LEADLDDDDLRRNNGNRIALADSVNDTIRFQKVAGEIPDWAGGDEAKLIQQ
jgi:hypothetical protein